jgi:hypothetical protein
MSRSARPTSRRLAWMIQDNPSDVLIAKVRRARRKMSFFQLTKWIATQRRNSAHA